VKEAPQLSLDTATVGQTENGAPLALLPITVDQPPSTPTDSDTAHANAVREGASTGSYVGLTASSTDPDLGDTVTYSLTDSAGGFFKIDANTGAVSVDTAGATGINFETAPGHAYSITVQASDGAGGTSAQTFSIAVEDVFTFAVPDSYTVNEDASLAPVAAAGVLANDTDVNGGPITATLNTGPLHASSFTFNADGSFSYTPVANYSGADRFTYKVDGSTESVSITVTAVQDAFNDTLTTSEDTAGTVNVLANDAFGAGAAVIGITNGAHGTVVNNLNGTVTYTPAADYNGTDSFTYTANTAGGTAETATVTVTVTAVKDAFDDTLTTNEDTAGTVNVLANDLFAGAGVTVTGVTNGAHGTVTNNNNGTVTYMPETDYFGTDTFTYTANSATGTAETATVNVTVAAVKDAPVLHDVPAGAVFANGPAVILAPALTITDVDNTTLASATVHVSAGAFTAHNDVLSVSAGGLAGTSISASYNAATETLTLSGTDTLAHYNQALEHVAFQTTNFANDRAQTIEWQANDGSAANNLSDLATTAISMPRSQTNDFGGNGHSGILWQNADGTPAIWSVDGTSLVSGQNVGFNPGPSWHEIGSGDFNGDGKADILWQNTDGTIAEWFMNGSSLISGGSVAFNPGSTWHVIDAGDFNGDGKSDILWQNNDGTPAVWLMNGLNILSGTNVGFNPGPAWHVIGAGDFNGDGKADILWQNADGTPAVWLMNGTSLISGQNVGFNPGSNWHTIGTGDFNGDGKADILWQNNDGTPAVWLMNGTSLISGQNVGINPGSAWHALTTGDYNGDGKADILWQNTDGTPAIWLMNGASLISGANVGFDPSNWHVIPQHDLLVG
jgi:hypothetical protein